MIKVFITGITGFAGSHLAQLLLSLGQYEISGTYLEDSSVNNISDREKIKLHKINLLDRQATEDLIAKERPDMLFHLAALTSPRSSFENPTETFTNNISAQIAILEALRKHDLTE